MHTSSTILSDIISHKYKKMLIIENQEKYVTALLKSHFSILNLFFLSIYGHVT